jgi:hypothetical protein
MGKTNKEWHAKNRMPKNPTRGQRIEWHAEHAKDFACREISLELEKLRALETRDKEERDREGYSKHPQRPDEWLDSE